MSDVAKQNRDEGIARVSKSNERWIDVAVAKFKSIRNCFHGPITGETVRLTLTLEENLEPPTHHNAWGALTRRLINEGVLIPTDQFTNMITPRSHARMTREYHVKHTEPYVNRYS